MFGVIKQIYQYSKTAITATYRAMNEVIGTCMPIIVGGLIVYIRTGDITAPLSIATITMVPQILVRSRLNYVSMLGEHKTKELTEAEKKEIRDKLNRFDEQSKISSDYQAKRGTSLQKEYNDHLKALKIEKSFFFRISGNDGNNHFLLGTNHTMSLEELPPFVQAKIHQLVKNPNAFIIGEMDSPPKYTYIGEQMVGEAFSSTLRLIKLLIMVNSISDLVKGFVCPWYLREDTDPKLTYNVLLMRSVLYQQSIKSRIFTFLIDFLNPGTFLSLCIMAKKGFFDGYYHGMDTDITWMRTGLGFRSQGFEDRVKFIISYCNLRKVSKMSPDEVGKIVQLALNSFQGQNTFEKNQASWEETNVALYKSYIDADLKRLQDTLSKQETLLQSESNKELHDNGISQYLSNNLSIRRQLNWFPEILKLFSLHSEGLVYVGAAHLPGELGLLALLSQNGFVIERMVKENQYVPEVELKSHSDKPIQIPLEHYESSLDKEAIFYYRQQKNRRQKCCGSKETETAASASTSEVKRSRGSGLAKR